MGYTSNYAEDEMKKAVDDGSPKTAKAKTGSRMKDARMASQDPKYLAHMKKKTKEKMQSMTPNNPKY